MTDITVTLYTMNLYLKEYLEKARTDGYIFVRDDCIIKEKPLKYTTVDLQYDSNEGIFLDSNRNVYFYNFDDISDKYLKEMLTFYYFSLDCDKKLIITNNHFLNS